MQAISWCTVLLLLLGCTKQDTSPAAAPPPSAGASADFVKYTIRAGSHFATHHPHQPIETEELTFAVRFDSSAIYTARAAANQYDINKLYGFSDNGGSHHQYSARVGWRWSEGALRLAAYVYNGGKVAAEELGPAPIGSTIACRIAVVPDGYLFECGEIKATLPRASTTAKGKGYLLYPYFGGDEPAPHDITIWIKSPLSPGGGM